MLHRILTTAALSCLCLTTIHTKNSLIISPYAVGAAFPLVGHFLGTTMNGLGLLDIVNDPRVHSDNDQTNKKNFEIIAIQQVINGGFMNRPSLKKSWFNWSLGCGTLGLFFAAYIAFKGDAHTGTKIAVGSTAATLLALLATGPFPGPVDDNRFGKFISVTNYIH